MKWYGVILDMILNIFFKSIFIQLARKIKRIRGKLQKNKGPIVKAFLVEARVNFNGLVMLGLFIGAAVLLAIIQIDNSSWLHSLSSIVAILFSIVTILIIFLETFLSRTIAIHSIGQFVGWETAISRSRANTGQTTRSRANTGQT